MASSHSLHSNVWEVVHTHHVLLIEGRRGKVISHQIPPFDTRS